MVSDDILDPVEITAVSKEYMDAKRRYDMEEDTLKMNDHLTDMSNAIKK